MKRSFMSLLSLATMACAAALASAAERFSDACTNTVSAIADGFTRLAVHVVDVLAPAATDDRAPAVRFLQAREFVARIQRRERIQVTNTWRLCPSI